MEENIPLALKLYAAMVNKTQFVRFQGMGSITYMKIEIRRQHYSPISTTFARSVLTRFQETQCRWVTIHHSHKGKEQFKLYLILNNQKMINDLECGIEFYILFFDLDQSVNQNS